MTLSTFNIKNEYGILTFATCILLLTTFSLSRMDFYATYSKETKQFRIFVTSNFTNKTDELVYYRK